MFKYLFWIVAVFALIYVFAWENFENSLVYVEDGKRNPASFIDFTPESTVFQFSVDHCSNSVSAIKKVSGNEKEVLMKEMTRIKLDKGTSIEDKNNVFYPLTNCVSIFISNTLMGAEGSRKSLK